MTHNSVSFMLQNWNFYDSKLKQIKTKMKMININKSTSKVQFPQFPLVPRHGLKLERELDMLSMLLFISRSKKGNLEYFSYWRSFIVPYSTLFTVSDTIHGNWSASDLIIPPLYLSKSGERSPPVSNEFREYSLTSILINTVTNMPMYEFEVWLVTSL